jgi:hypothetical protein
MVLMPLFTKPCLYANFVVLGKSNSFFPWTRAAGI